jgi:hypothetical protein
MYMYIFIYIYIYIYIYMYIYIFISMYVALQASTDANTSELSLLHAPCAGTIPNLKERVCLLTNVADLLLTCPPNRYPKLDTVNHLEEFYY